MKLGIRKGLLVFGLALICSVIAFGVLPGTASAATAHDNVVYLLLGPGVDYVYMDYSLKVVTPGQPFDQIVSNAPNLATCKLIHGDGGLSKAPFYAMVITAKAGREDSEDVAYTWKSFSKGSDSVCADRSIDKEPQKLNFAFFGQMVIKGTFGTHTYRYGLAQGNQMGAFNNWWFTFAGGAQRKGDCLVSPDGAYVVSRLKTGGEDNAFLISYNRAIIGT